VVLTGHRTTFRIPLANRIASLKADPDRTSKPLPISSPTVTLVGAFVVLSFCLILMRPWWNRYLGLTNEGWLQFFGLRILQGQVPYRDFYLYVPPAQALTMAALISLFGNRIMVGEMFGLIAALTLFLALYLWLTRLFPAFWSVLAVIFAAAIYLDSSAETLGGVHLTSILYPVLAFLAASFALDRDRGGLLAFSVAGFLAGVSLLTKQTAGVATTLSLGVAFPAIIAMRGRGWHGVRAVTVFAIAWVIPVGSTCVWLAEHGALQDFLSDTFLHGTSSKGSLPSLLQRQLVYVAASHNLRICAALALAAMLLLAFVYQPGDSENWAWPQRLTVLIILCVGVMATGVVFAVEHLNPLLHENQWSRIVMRNTPLFVGELGSLILLLRYGCLFLRRPLNWREEQYLLASTVSFVSAFLSSFSGAHAESILAPAFPFVFAFALSHVRSDTAGRLVQGAAIILALSCLATMANWKLRSPYAWADWQEGNVRSATVETNFPELRGIRVTPETDRFLERVVADIQRNSRPDEPVAEFCCMPILYLLAHRAPATFGYVHYIDVTPDDVYRADAERLEKNPPAVIVTVERSEEELREGEMYFRGGKPSGERTLWTVLRNLGSRYRLADTLTTPNTNKRVEVWVRQDR
jgi:hypothetical protein